MLRSYKLGHAILQGLTCTRLSAVGRSLHHHRSRLSCKCAGGDAGVIVAACSAAGVIVAACAAVFPPLPSPERCRRVSASWGAFPNWREISTRLETVGLSFPSGGSLVGGS